MVWHTMLRLLLSLASLAAIGSTGWWLYTSSPEVRSVINNVLPQQSFHTLEARFSAKQLMEKNKSLLKNGAYSFEEPKLYYFPYALLEVKYSKGLSQTREGLMLWSLEDGELVLNTTSWETTHGFQDCLNAKADRVDFKLLKVLAKRGGLADRKLLKEELKYDDEQLDSVVESCRRKKLIVQKGNDYRLHFHSPKLAATPETKIEHWLVTKPHAEAEQTAARYSPAQMQRLAQEAFDEDFTVRSCMEIYLPVWQLTVRNPDSSQHITYWNAMNAKELKVSHFR